MRSDRLKIVFMLCLAFVTTGGQHFESKGKKSDSFKCLSVVFKYEVTCIFHDFLNSKQKLWKYN